MSKSAASLKKTHRPSQAPTHRPPVAPTEDVVADEGQRLRQGQFFLAALGYSVAGDCDPAGAADGVFGHHTRGAILQFQADQDLQPNGHLDAPTWDALCEAHREGCEVESSSATTDEGDAMIAAEERLAQGIHELTSDVLVDLPAIEFSEEEIDMLDGDRPSA